MFSEDDPRLAALLDGIVRLAAGELDSRIAMSPARDELDAIIMGINLLAEDLQSIYQELEERVESRTRLLNEAHLEMQKMALTDSLTGLPNRAALVNALKAAQETAAEAGTTAALLLLDLDSFKSINDTLGHSIGDQVLVAVGKRIGECLQPEDIVARLAGDEFAVLLQGTTPGRATGVGNRIVAALNGAVEVENGRSVRCGVSVGLRVAAPGQTAEQLLVEADMAMYASKGEGRNKLKVFEPSMLYARQLRNQLVGDLREAIAASQLVLHYQPVVDLATGRIEGAEALVRWNHPSRGLVMPDEFIPLAEEAGLVSELGTWVLRAAVAQLREWRSTGLACDRFTMRINVSAPDLQRLEFVEEVRDTLLAAGIEPRRLVLELTESAIIQGNDLDRYSLTSLRQLGVGLEIDDFGTGYSSISYLRRLPVDTVKVDRSFLTPLGTDSTQPAFIAAILQLIRACGLDAVWEGIETEEQVEHLKSIGCTSGQGYYFSRPLPEPDFTELLAKNAAATFTEPATSTEAPTFTDAGPSTGPAPGAPA